MGSDIDIIVLVSADIEWRAIRNLLPNIHIQSSPFGEYFQNKLETASESPSIIYFQGGWGKIAAAASSQFIIDQWKPKLLINLGTCGGFEGLIDRGSIVLADRTIVYDIYEQMGDAQAHLAKYSTTLDLSWLREPYPAKVVKTVLVSGDRDLDPKEINDLHVKYGAVAGDWESGAIAYVANLNDVPCLILRGVSDLVSETGGEAYDDSDFFKNSAKSIMTQLIKSLPKWIKNSDLF